MKKPKSKRFKAVQFRLKVVEVTGLEPTTFWSLTRRATKLRYTSMTNCLYIILNLKLKAKRFIGDFLKILKIFLPFMLS